MVSFIKENSEFLLIIIGAVGATCAGCLAFILKSRCTRISCCGAVIDRDVLPSNLVNITPNNNNNNNI